jgi:hypothetical protein
MPMANLSVNRTACNLRMQVPSTLWTPPAGYLKHSEKSRATSLAKKVAILTATGDISLFKKGEADREYLT